MNVPEKGIIIAIALLALEASGIIIIKTVTFGKVEEGTKIFFEIEVKPHDPPNSGMLMQREANLPPQAKKIGAIVIRKSSALGGNPRLISGGPNMNFANLVLFTEHYFPIDVTIEFYTTPTTRKNCLIINFATYLRSKNRYRG